MDKLLSLGRRIYEKTPSSLMFVFYPLVPFVWLLHALRLDRWTITGDESTTKSKLTIGYAGGKENKNYLVDLAFGGTYSEKLSGKVWLWQVRRDLRRCDESTVKIAEVPRILRRLFPSEGCFYLPFWVRTEVDISGGLGPLIDSESLRSDLRKVEKNGLTYEVTKQLSDFDYFYHRMYVPYIGKAHGDQAFIAAYNGLKKGFRNCDLLLVKKGEESIAGMSILYERRRPPRLLCAGVKDGDTHLVREGAVAAGYYFSLIYLQQRGFSTVNLGGSRPFLKDGVLHFKRKWHPRIVGPVDVGFLLGPMSKSPAVSGFLTNNPFIFVDDARFHGAAFVEEGELAMESALPALRRKYYLPGMTNLYGYRFAEGSSRLPAGSEDTGKYLRWKA